MVGLAMSATRPDANSDGGLASKISSPVFILGLCHRLTSENQQAIPKSSRECYKGSQETHYGVFYLSETTNLAAFFELEGL